MSCSAGGLTAGIWDGHELLGTRNVGIAAGAGQQRRDNLAGLPGMSPVPILFRPTFPRLRDRVQSWVVGLAGLWSKKFSDPHFLQRSWSLRPEVLYLRDESNSL